jgi:hypothetical protein
VTATKTGNARARYNRVADSTRALVRAWNAATSRDDATLADALASASDAGDRLQRLAEQGAEEFDGDYLGTIRQLQLVHHPDAMNLVVPVPASGTI